MKFLNDKNDEFEMFVRGYQYPHLKDEPYDADWLNVHIRVRLSRGSWSKEDPCILTWELMELAEWFEVIAVNQATSSSISFMEPELSFQWCGIESTLRIYLAYSLRPSWSPYYGPNNEDKLLVDFVTKPEELHKTSKSLQEEVKKFPIRVKV